MKKDGDKPSLELIPRKCLEGMGYVLKFGAEKYDRHLWREGMEWSRLLGGAMRHITAFNDGEDLDPESGQSHLYHAMCCLAFIGTYQDTKMGTDDRAKSLQTTQTPQAIWQDGFDRAYEFLNNQP